MIDQAMFAFVVAFPSTSYKLFALLEKALSSAGM